MTLFLNFILQMKTINSFIVKFIFLFIVKIATLLEYIFCSCLLKWCCKNPKYFNIGWNKYNLPSCSHLTIISFALKKIIKNTFGIIYVGVFFQLPFSWKFIISEYIKYWYQMIPINLILSSTYILEISKK